MLMLNPLSASDSHDTCIFRLNNYIQLMKILIIEDEISLLDSITEYFSKENFTCETAKNYNEGSDKINLYSYDCILLDIGLPDGNGLKLLEVLKAQKKMEGVIIISAKDSIDDKVKGLNLGADDYMTKPLHLSELNARIQSVIRRKNFDATNIIEAGKLKINLIDHSVSSGDNIVNLTKKEFDILTYLIANKKKVVSKNSLAEHGWGDHIDQSESFDFVFAHIKNLKKKLKSAHAEVDIKNIYGVGYKLIIG